MDSTDVAKTLRPGGASHGATGSGDRAAAERLSGSPDELKWAARLVGAGSLLTLVYEVAYLIFDRHLLWIDHGSPLFLHLVNIGLYIVAVIMTLRVGPWMRRNWKKVAFSFSAVLIISSMWLTIITGETEPLLIALMLFLAGTGPFLSWGEQTQGLLSLIACIAFAIASAALPAQRGDPYQWLGLLIAAAIGLFSTALERRLHRARRRAEEELLQSRETLMAQERIRMAGQLASGIAHDLNNTLNVIKLRLAVLMQDETVLSAHAVRLQSIERAVEDAARTVARVRELGRTRADDRLETAQLSEIVAQAIDLARTTIEGDSSLGGTPIKIESRLSEPVPQVYGAGSELRQVFLNLLLNAYEAMDGRGKIVIDGVAQERTVRVTVADEGAGIPAVQLPRIFDPFFTTKGTHGTGLGLSISRNIMESLGGQITAANRPQRGAIFTLEFLIASAVAAKDCRNAPAPAPGNCRFLLVDDEMQNLEALREILLLRGFSADTANSGVEALAKLASAQSYDVVLCDLTMPRMNGWEIARSALKSNPKLNFYIVTGWGKQPQSQIPAGLPVCGVLSKPVDVGELERIAQLVQHQASSQREGFAGL